jgi:hypothetical protein
MNLLQKKLNRINALLGLRLKTLDYYPSSEFSYKTNVFL